MPARRAEPRSGRSLRRLDWQRYNFLENLIGFCVCAERRVPAESGVRFHFRIDQPKQSICLLFHIDRPQDPLIREKHLPRPDYMVLYLRAGLSLCTIIEMKGVSEKNLDHGIDQIKSLRDRLRREIADHLPAKFRVKYQGILLCPPNADKPMARILKEDKAGLTILPVQSPHSADLSFYVTNEIKLTSRAPPPPRNTSPALLNLIEDVLVHRFSASRAASRRPTEEGLILHYRPTASSVVTFTANRANGLISIQDSSSDKLPGRIQNCLQQAGLLASRLRISQEGAQ